MRNQLCLLLVGLSLGIGIAPKGYAQTIRCKGVLGNVRVPSLEVPANHLCILKGTTVLGDVTVGTNARLLASEAKIKGNVFAQDALYLDLGSLSQVKGFIQRPDLMRRLWP